MPQGMLLLGFITSPPNTGQAKSMELID